MSFQISHLNMEAKKILITGASGMLGHALSDAFRDYELLLTDRGELDITDPEAITDAIESFRPEALINAAAYTAVDACEEPANQPLATLLNATAVGYLAQATSSFGIPLVHFSTDYIFDGKNPEGYDETFAHFAPVNAYGATKLAGERELQKHTDKFYLIRTQWLYGRHGKNFVDTMLQLGKDKKEIEVVNDQHGSPTWTVDLAQQTRLILEKRLPFGVYHGVNLGVTTWYHFAKKIFELAGMDVRVLPVTSDRFPRPAQRPEWSALRNTKLPTMPRWEEGVKGYMKTQR